MSLWVALSILVLPLFAIATPAPLPLQPQCLNQVKINSLKEIAPALDGQGVKIALVCRSLTYLDGLGQNDYKPFTAHNCFGGKEFKFHDNQNTAGAVSQHSTAICSILFGYDDNAFDSQLGQFKYKGIVPQADGEIFEFWHFLTEYIFANRPPDADIITASMGSGFEDWWTRGIDSLAANHGQLIVAGIGNGRDAWDTLLYPGACANVIGVGVVDSVDNDELGTLLSEFALPYPEHSSFGPTIDKRCKPDIVAPGNYLTADSLDPNLYEPTGNFSSFATPIVTATAALLMQKAKLDPNLTQAISPQGGNCVIKAILLNSATKLAFWHKGKTSLDDDHTAPLDYIQGAGMLNAVGAYENLISGQASSNDATTAGWDNNLLDNRQRQRVYKLKVLPKGDKTIAITAAWNKHFSQTYPFDPQYEKDANLRIELWAVDINDANNDYLLDYSDSDIDNVEHIYCKSDPNFTDYEIVISYSDVDTLDSPSPKQRYGLAFQTIEQNSNSDILWYDLNANGTVDKVDYAIFFDNYFASQKNPDSYNFGDINIDGVIDFNDLEILLGRKGTQADWIEN